jgi:hypothetical protein
MGGQACVLYGGTEFSRDTDIVLVPDAATLSALKQALDELHAKVIAVPPFDEDYLRRGFAVHFRCAHPEARDIRVDVMSVMRGVAPFEELWSRRTTMELDGYGAVELLGLPDLIQAKKTQRDKDWPMIRRLVEAHFDLHHASPTEAQIRFWLLEARTVAILQAAANHPQLLAEVVRRRPLLAQLGGANVEAIEQALQDEERREREADRRYWAPLLKELEQIRHRK